MSTWGKCSPYEIKRKSWEIISLNMKSIQWLYTYISMFFINISTKHLIIILTTLSCFLLQILNCEFYVHTFSHAEDCVLSLASSNTRKLSNPMIFYLPFHTVHHLRFCLHAQLYIYEIPRAWCFLMSIGAMFSATKSTAHLSTWA